MFKISNLVGGVFEVVKGCASGIAKATGLDETVVSNVITGVSTYIEKDEIAKEKVQTLISSELDKARQHELAFYSKSDKAGNFIRTITRPVVTMASIGCLFAMKIICVLSMLNDPEKISSLVKDFPDAKLMFTLTTYDYAIVGGILAFWFGGKFIKSDLFGKR
ncbi:MAG: hypothetical protein AMJ43_07810 [Coxiella sp. DG_40]|nr:MAG: hypothetical protein AMJ43_07810 [Coxiella sp. DG_40]